MIREAIVLAGGLGTRLSGVVNDRPKPMAEVGGRPFLEWLLLSLKRAGVRRVVLGTGYRSEVIEDYFGGGARWGLEIAYSRETLPLGTGGALREALQRTSSDPLVAMNGDSYCPVDLARLAATHEERKARVSLWLVEVGDCARYGTVQVAPDGQIQGVHEKSGPGKAGLINAGIYVFNRQAIAEIPEGRMISLEEEVFPSLVGRGLYGVVGSGPFLDIGTPESFAAAADVLARELERLEDLGEGQTPGQSDRLRGEQVVRNHLGASAEVKRRVAEECAEVIVTAARLIARAFLEGSKVLLCGNGGSAADCQHMATEFVSRLRRDFERPGLPAIALTTDTSFLTAYANDCGFEGVFERQVRALGRPGDVLIGISTSGNSGNVIRAVEAARALKMRTIILTGGAGRLRDMADVVIAVPSADTQHIQEAHLGIEHVLCDLVERSLFGEKRADGGGNR